MRLPRVRQVGLGLVACGAVIAAGGCHRPSAPPVAPSLSTVIPAAVAAAAPQLTTQPLRFTDVTQPAEIHWTYRNGASGTHAFIETTGGGVAVLDYNRDGWPDLFAVQGGEVPGTPTSKARLRGDALYRNNGDGTFTDVAAVSGLTRAEGYGQGVSVADYDNDGWPDLYVTAYGGNHLYRNRRNGTFQDVTVAVGVADRGREAPWPLSSAWADYNHDGRLDLFICHYVRWSPATNEPCRNPAGELSYCRPQVYEGSASRLYRQNADGTFTDVSKKAGIAALSGKSMGAAWVDFDADGWLDLFVTNDTAPNYLLANNRNGTFTERALTAGVAVGATGNPMSGMGIGIGDYDGDGRVDLFDVNFAAEPKGVWRNTGIGFEDRSYASNLASTNLQFLGFGLEACDYDLDGYLDLVVGNGHVLDDPSSLGEGTTYAQSQQLFHNQQDGTFKEDLRSLGDLAQPRITRGLAITDYDRDGDLDLAMVGQNGPLQLFRNDGGNAQHWVRLRLEGVRTARDAVGAQVRGKAGGRTHTAWVLGGSSYCSASERWVTLGLGDAPELMDVQITWPNQRVQQLGTLHGDRAYLVREGETAVIEEPRRASGAPGR